MNLKKYYWNKCLFITSLLLYINCGVSEAQNVQQEIKLNNVGISIKTSPIYLLIDEDNMKDIKNKAIEERKKCYYDEALFNKIESNKNWQAIIENDSPNNIISFVRFPQSTHISDKEMKEFLKSLCEKFLLKYDFEFIGSGDGKTKIGSYVNFLFKINVDTLSYFSEMYLINGENASYLITSNNLKINSIKDIINSIVEFSDVEIKKLQDEERDKTINNLFSGLKTNLSHEEIDTLISIMKVYNDTNIENSYNNGGKILISDCCSFVLPNNLEVQDGSWKKFNDYLSKKNGVEYQSDMLWLQQKGLNANIDSSRKHYIRMSFKFNSLSERTLQSLESKPNWTKEDLIWYDNEIDSELKNYKLSKVLKIEKSKIVKIGKYYSIMKSFTSQMGDKPIKISQRHMLLSDTKIFYIFIEYWEQDYDLYKESMDLVLNSLEFIE